MDSRREVWMRAIEIVAAVPNIDPAGADAIERAVAELVKAMDAEPRPWWKFWG